MKKVLLTTLAMILTLTVQAELRLPQLFQTGMVLQRHKTIPVWGKADAHEKVTILFGKKQFATTADGKGDWRIDLPAMKAGGPYSMEIKGEGQDRILLTDVMVGDVWLCSGQSNMDVTIERVYKDRYPTVAPFLYPHLFADRKHMRLRSCQRGDFQRRRGQ